LLDPSERADLERVFERQERAAGEKVFSIGEPGDSLYIVGAGSVELYAESGAAVMG
jgi:CRP-like cAMP-binding protein